jgi:hypothetical protein
VETTLSVDRLADECNCNRPVPFALALANVSDVSTGVPLIRRVAPSGA